MNHSDLTNTTYDIYNKLYWNEDSLNHEINRIYDICNGCRLCFNLCPSFPFLFNTIDHQSEVNMAKAVQEGRIAARDEKEVYDDQRPEGEHAVEASDEALLAGKVENMSSAEKWRVVDLCYQCKLCDPVCPYTPAKGHDFQLDFPKLMTRAQAIRTKRIGVKTNDKFLSNTDFTGKLGTSFSLLTNWANQNKLARTMMHHVVGIHKDRNLPKFYSETLEKWFKKHQPELKLTTEPIDKVVIFGTCYVGNNAPDVGIAAIEILKHNNVEIQYPKQQCCGAPYLSPGDFDGFKKQSLPNILEFAKWVEKGYKIVVTGPPTCSLTIKTEYLHYFEKTDKPLYEKIQSVAQNTFDISEYLMTLHKAGNLRTDFINEIGTVNYHLSCHLKAQNIGYKSRDLMRLVPNTKVNMIDKCSGMDGGWGMKSEFFEESMGMAKKLVNTMEKKECSVSCSDCTLAGVQILQASDGKIKSEHPIAVLHRAYGLDKKTN